MNAGPRVASAMAPSVEALGDAALLVRLGEAIDPALNRSVYALAACLQATRPREVLDIVPAYASVAVVFAPGRDPQAARARVGAWIARAVDAWSGAPPSAGGNVAGDPIEITVHYDGPDLEEIAAHAGMDVQELLRRHVAATYTVAMLGFAPGFPYLLGMDPALAMPRRPTPRAEVPAGSVGIADAQTGIYPQASPGGWRLLGRTDARLFTPDADPPTLLRPGDRVRFRAA